MIAITGITIHDGEPQKYTSIDRFPDHCPICHHGIEPIKQSSAHFDTNKRELEMVFRCPRKDCQSLFIARYVSFGFNTMLTYSRSVPSEPRDSDFSEQTRKLSPQYCEIANEAQKAEDAGWKLIAGPGYRKALEFLIKDYLCLAKPQDPEAIKKVQLGSCIANYVENEKVKAVAAHAVWLGNDETHYARKWNDKDLVDLKKLIDLTVHWIEMEEMTASRPW